MATRPSPPCSAHRLTAAPLCVVGAVAALAAALGAAPVVRAQDALRFDGEYGLYAKVTEFGLNVRWITERPGVGELRAFVDGEEIARLETLAGQAHSANIEATAAEVTLLYGSKGSELHRTVIVRDSWPEPDVEIEGVSSVFMLGDVHGQFDRVVTLLGNAGLIDAELRWTGGENHLVFLGDIFDRGHDVTRVLWFLYGLERQAAEAGGAVHVVLGNHELMVMSSDLRYVGGKEAMIAETHGLGYGEMFDPHESVLGRWLSRKPGLVRMEDLLLAHGGISPQYADYSLQEFQDSLRSFIDEELFTRWNDQAYLDSYGEDPEATDVVADSAGIVRRYEFFFGGQSVMWYRDLVRTDTLATFLDRVLKRFDSHVHVVGHTPVETISEFYGGKLIAADLVDAATEMLHLTKRDDGGWDRVRIPLLGEPTPLAASHSDEP